MRDRKVTWDWNMMVLGLSATLIVACTVMALMLLLGIDTNRHATTARLF